MGPLMRIEPLGWFSFYCKWWSRLRGWEGDVTNSTDASRKILPGIINQELSGTDDLVDRAIDRYLLPYPFDILIKYFEFLKAQALAEWFDPSRVLQDQRNSWVGLMMSSTSMAIGFVGFASLDRGDLGMAMGKILVFTVLEILSFILCKIEVLGNWTVRNRFHTVQLPF